ncbi:MAG: sodium pump decarboxylase subunit gamma [Ruminococcaceae bacterium]|nr:sodium pump decarboxylase subunit gamma [Oscillospiraceae bacterium]
MDYSHLFVCLMGMGTVFFGLICLILLVSLMGRICQATERKTAPAPTAAVPAAPVSAPVIGPELVAAISAAIAEDMGTDVSAIRIHSIRKI